MSYVTPTKRIITNEDLKLWEKSDTYSSLVDFIQTLSDSVKGKTNDAPVEVSSCVSAVLELLNQIENLVKENPVVQDKEMTRFGKVEFRDFYDSVSLESEALLQPIDAGDATEELAGYLEESWGNRARIDYGSGHELSFMCFLLCLVKLGHLDLATDAPALVLRVFNKYMSIMRLLQKEYWLEPAGSHGVWGLDDYHFLPFLFGASQLATHPHLKPKSIHNKEYVEMFKDKYMYFHCIWFINSVKTASLRWHSPMLDDISGVKSWQKISYGMMKMYKAEVLNKLPIMQHFLFGSILKCPEGVTEDDSAQGPEHVHAWGDCCGIKLPSLIGAHELEKPIPFD